MTEWSEPHRDTEAFLARHPRISESHTPMMCRAVQQDTSRTWGHCKSPGRWILDGRTYCSAHADIRLRAFHQHYQRKTR